MNARSMADDSSEQVPDQQTGESSVSDTEHNRGDDRSSDEQGMGRDASSR